MALDYNIIGQRIKQARLAKNYTQEELSEKIDVSVAFLSRVDQKITCLKNSLIY